MDFYGTIGPSCSDVEILSDMLREGMTGIRVNLSHGGLRDNMSFVEKIRKASMLTGMTVKIMADLIGPELRTKKLREPLELKEGANTDLFFMPEDVLMVLTPGMTVLLDDGKLELLICEDTNRAQIIRGGILSSGKSITLPEGILRRPTLTKEDLENIALFKEAGITEVMLPFVRDAKDLTTLRGELKKAGADHVRIYAKLENKEGLASLKDLIPYADAFVIARGDLGNAMPLWELPAAQKNAARILREAGKSFMIVTQMLDSMHDRAVPTRAEVLDIFNAVLDGADSVMLTGETAAGKYPVLAMKYLVKTGEEGLKYQMDHSDEMCENTLK